MPIAKASKGMFFAGISYIPYCAMRISAYALSILGSFGRSLAERLHRHADTFYAIHIIHNFYHAARWTTEPICHVRNIAKKSVIRNEDDVKKAKEYIRQVIGDECLQVTNFQVRGAKADGICYGASLFLIKGLLEAPVHSEKELIHFVCQFKKGFPAEAAAVQILLNAYTSCELYIRKTETLEQFLKGVRLQKADTEEALNKIKNDVLRKDLEESDLNELKKWNHIASVLNLKLVRSSMRACSKEQFNHLPNGIYMLSFKADAKRHSIVFLKMDFGSYFLDPSTGLERCDAKNPDHLSRFFKSKGYKGDELRVEEYSKTTEVAAAAGV